MHFMDENFWVAISFVIFIYFAYRPIKRAINSALDAKIAEIKNSIEEASKLKEDAKKLLDQAEKEMAEFQQLKDKLMLEAKNSTNDFINKKSKEMEMVLARKRDNSIKLLEQQKLKISEHLKQEFTAQVVALVRSYIQHPQNAISDEEIIASIVKDKHFVEQ